MELDHIPSANLTLGAMYVGYLPYSTWSPYYRYTQMQVMRAGTSTAGKVTAFLTPDGPAWVAKRAERVRLI